MTERETLALELADQIMAHHGKLPEDMYQKLKRVFSDEEMIALFWQIGTKNAANWFLIAMNIDAQA